VQNLPLTNHQQDPQPVIVGICFVLSLQLVITKMAAGTSAGCTSFPGTSCHSTHQLLPRGRPDPSLQGMNFFLHSTSPPVLSLPMERPISTLALLRGHPLARCCIPKDVVWSLAISQLRTNWGQPTARVCLCCSKGPTRVCPEQSLALHCPFVAQER